MSRFKVAGYIIATIVIIVSICIVEFGFPSPAPPDPVTVLEPSPSTSCRLQPPFLDSANGIGVTNVITSSSEGTQEYIGLSEGKFAFGNTSDPDGMPRCQASQELNQGNVKEAEKLWIQALQLESNDAEVLIYQENQRILDAQLPYISIIVGVTTGAVISNGLDVLQGTYAAQKRFNQDPKNSIQLRIIIANFGSTSTNTGLVARQIITATQKDDKVKAMVDLPTVANTAEVIGILSHGDFPIVLSTGSTSNQENGGNFFHIAATTAEQGQQAAKYVEQNCPNASDEQRLFDCQGSSVTAFIDAGDNYSSTLGSAFVKQLFSDKAANKTDKDVTLVPYDSTNSNSIVDKVKAFGNSPPTLIYFAGDAIHANILLQSLPQTPQYANLRVLGGDALYQVGTYRAHDYPRLNFTSFAYPDEWSILKPKSAPPEFFCDYAQDFAGGVVSSPKCSAWQTTGEGRYGYRYNRPENEAILSYDALEVILVGNQLATTGDILLRDQLLQSIRSIDEAHPFEGVSGRIAFGPDGNPISKAILVLRVNKGGYTRQEKSYGVF